MKLSWTAFIGVAVSSFAFGHQLQAKDSLYAVDRHMEDADVGILSEQAENHPGNRMLGVYNVGNNSCIPRNACDGSTYCNYYAVIIGDSSCLGDRSCSSAGYNGYVTIGESSCHGTRACQAVGYGSIFDTGSGNATIGNQSCLGEHACSFAGYDRPAVIGDGSCIGKEACNQGSVADFLNARNIHTATFTIGSGSCTCEGCCKSLLEGSIVGDCQCTSIAEGCNGTKVEPISGLCSPEPTIPIMPSVIPSSTPSTSPTSPHQDLVFDELSNVLGLTQSNEIVDLSHLANKDDAPQHLSFLQDTKVLSLSGSNATVDLSILDDPHHQELEWNGVTKMLELTHSSSVGVDLSTLTQDLKFDEASNVLFLTQSNQTVDLSHLVGTTLRAGAQDLAFSDDEKVLSLSGSTANVDLSSLDKDLEWNEDTKTLGLTHSKQSVTLSRLVQNLTMTGDGKTLVLSEGGGSVNLSPLRLATVQGTIDAIVGKDTTHVEIRKLEAKGQLKATSARELKKGDKFPIVGYGGLEGTTGWTIINSGRVLGISIAVNEGLKGSGFLKVNLADCTASSTTMNRLGQEEDVLTLRSGDGRAKTVKFQTPIPIQAGAILCFQAARVGKVESDDKDNAANVLILLEQ